jgi:hypothetical protein
MERELTAKLGPERPWLGTLDEGFLTHPRRGFSPIKGLNELLAIAKRAGYTQVCVFGWKHRNTSIVADNLHGNMVITHLIAAPTKGVHLNDCIQLFSRVAGLKVADTREKFVGFRRAKVMVVADVLDQILAAEGITNFLFENLFRDKLTCSSDLVKLFIEGRFSEQYKVLQGKKARSCGRAGTELLTNMQCGACESERPYCKAPARASLAAVVAPTSSPASTSRAHGMLLPISFYFGASRCVYMYFTMSCSG